MTRTTKIEPSTIETNIHMSISSVSFCLVEDCAVSQETDDLLDDSEDIANESVLVGLVAVLIVSLNVWSDVEIGVSLVVGEFVGLDCWVSRLERVSNPLDDVADCVCVASDDCGGTSDAGDVDMLSVDIEDNELSGNDVTDAEIDTSSSFKLKRI